MRGIRCDMFYIPVNGEFLLKLSTFYWKYWDRSEKMQKKRVVIKASGVLDVTKPAEYQRQSHVILFRPIRSHRFSQWTLGAVQFEIHSIYIFIKKVVFLFVFWKKKNWRWEEKREADDHEEKSIYRRIYKTCSSFIRI